MYAPLSVRTARTPANEPLGDLGGDDSERRDAHDHRDAPDDPAGDRHREHVAVTDGGDRRCRPPQRVEERRDTSFLADVLGERERGCSVSQVSPAAPTAMRPALRRKYVRLSVRRLRRWRPNGQELLGAQPRTQRNARSRAERAEYGRIASPWVMTISREVHSWRT